jgi:hypothetical protein
MKLIYKNAVYQQATPAVLYHATSWQGLAGILETMELRPRRDVPFVSLSSKPVASHDIQATDVVLVLDPRELGQQVQEVQYTPKWYRQHPDHGAYIAGEGWAEQYTAPDDCFEYDEEAEEEVEDQDCLDEASRQAELQAFLDKRDEQEWISVLPYEPVHLNPTAVLKILVVDPTQVELAQQITRQYRVEPLASRIDTVQYQGHLYREATRKDQPEMNSALTPGWYMDLESGEKHTLYGPFASEEALSKAYYYNTPFTHDREGEFIEKGAIGATYIGEETAKFIHEAPDDVYGRGHYVVLKPASAFMKVHSSWREEWQQWRVHRPTMTYKQFQDRHWYLVWKNRAEYTDRRRRINDIRSRPVQS